MEGAELTLVLSGHLRRPQSADLRPFWRGFIELQKKLPAKKLVSQIVVHSWNPDLADLARVVYAPHAELHEHQVCFYSEFVQQIEPPDRFEHGLNRLESTWKNVSIQSVLGNARSRARAIQLMDELPAGEGQVLITRWDLGQTGSTQVNQLVADAALPEEYLYMSYFSEVDEGYADMWLLAPWQLARRFGRFDAFVLDALTGQNRYLELFTETGWPRARVKTRYETVLSHPLGQRVYAVATKIVRGLQGRARGDALPQRIVRRLTGSLQRFLVQPPVTAENSCVPDFEPRPTVFPAFQALNIHALLKYFILSEGLRDRTRFLTHDDFEITAQSGQLINPQPIVLLVSDADDTAVACLIAESPLPLAAVYQMAEGAVREHVPDGRGDWVTEMLQPTSSAPRDLMVCALNAADKHVEGTLPALLMPTVDRYLGCADWFYVNALLKYIVWSDLGYVGLDCARRGRPHQEFPDLQVVRGGDAFSLHMAAGTVAGIRALLVVADPELVDMCGRANRMLLEFPVVVKGENLF
jgi:hypothetical protein